MNSRADTGLDDLTAMKCELASDLLRFSGRLRLGVTGWSMLPTIWPGDMVVVEKVDGGQVQQGDVVLFRRDHRLFVHRVIAEDRCNRIDVLFVTRGDGMRRADAPVSSSEFLGRVNLILRDGRSIELKRTLSFFERIVAALVRRFYWVARVLVEIHVMRVQEQKIYCQS